jgi:D-glycero-D-manno-heptose 1,7-bisphosphate phosphatase
MKKNAAIFLDRDGTINEEVGYLDSLKKLKLYDNTTEAIRMINESGMKTVVITNQSGVARGYFTEEFVRTVHSFIEKILGEEGAFIDEFYYCPHHPEGMGVYRRVCSCRKPEAGMVIRASEELNIDLKCSYIIGDMLKDLQAAGRVGAKAILVRTGYGLNTIEKDLITGSADSVQPHYIAEDILDAVKWIMQDRKQ